MKINKKATLATAGVLGIAAIVGTLGTMSYFTDNDTATNNFTVGNVDVTLYESQLHRVNSNVKPQYNESSNASPVDPDNYNNCLNGNPYCTPNIAVITDLAGVSAWQNGHVRTQNVAGLTGSGQAGVFSDAQIIADADIDGTAEAATATDPGNYKGYVEAEYDDLVPGKQVRKFVYAKNTGENSAYVRVKVTIPADVANFITVKAPHTPQETIVAGTTADAVQNQNINGTVMDYAYVTKTDSTATDGTVTMTFVFTDALKPGEMTYWSPITTVRINETVKESDFNDGVLETLRSTGFGIKVDVDAIQSEGFANAAAAWAAFDANSTYEDEVNE